MFRNNSIPNQFNAAFMVLNSGERVWKYKLGSRIGYQIDVEVGMRGMRRAQVHVKLFQKKNNLHDRGSDP